MKSSWQSVIWIAIGLVSGPASRHLPFGCSRPLHQKLDSSFCQTVRPDSTARKVERKT